MGEQEGITRRKMISRLSATGVAVLGGSSGFAAQERQESMTTQKLEDPKGKYPKPPFKEQSQHWPGLASKMEPRPDHGERIYKGSGRLAGRKALITGGDSGMGRAAAIAFAREGADVAINYFPTEQPDADEVIALIKEAGRKAVALPGDLRDENFCKKLVADAVRQLGGLDILVCNAARQQTRPSILDISSEDFDATMKTNVYAPFWIIKAALPHLPPRGGDHRHHVRAGDEPLGGAVRLRPDQGRDHELRALAGQAACTQGHPGERRGAGPDLDALAGLGRGHAGEVAEVRRRHPDGASRPAGRARLHLRPA